MNIRMILIFALSTIMLAALVYLIATGKDQGTNFGLVAGSFITILIGLAEALTGNVIEKKRRDSSVSPKEGE